MSDINNIGYDPKQNPYDDFLRSLGMDRSFVEIITNLDYNNFIKQLRERLCNLSLIHI